MKSDIKDRSLAQQGARRVEWVEKDMPVLRQIRERFEDEKPLEGVRLSACLHITTETANLARTLKAGGADLVLCASNPLSTQDEVAAALAHEFDVPTFAIRGEDNDTYYAHVRSALAHEPNMTMDDGADLVTAILTDRTDLAPGIIASLEETTTGVIRLRAMEADGVLKFPVFAVNDAQTKHLFDNRYGTGQSTVDGILRSTRMLIAGKTVVVCGYGMCGRGVASRMKGLGAHVVVAEVDPLRALEAAMDSFKVMSVKQAARHADLFVTVTGCCDVLRREHFEKMKDGAFVANAGHFNVEINIDDLSELAEDIVRGVTDGVDEFVLENGKSIYLLGEGRLINLAAANGHPACVMDMSFAVQALTAEHAAKNRGRLEHRVQAVPDKVDRWVAEMKLKAMGIRIDKLTERQKKYLVSWQEGT
ncbi:MAG: adenosylhomocysteinase [Candidatus Brocadiia bacterium]|nr:adenosylhomocysteinase [Candidatus Brocadiia bacterium]